jgi:pimeloyl-ACP methyl ester carboxylesterase
MPVQRIETPDGISWHVETFSPTNPAQNPQYVVLIPSGEGDAGSLIVPASLLAARGYHTITFDMPGFSRTTAPPEAYSHPVTPQKLATQVHGLMDALDITRATFVGSSSAGLTVLGLIALYPERVLCGIVHEVPFGNPPDFLEWQKLPDQGIKDACRPLFAHGMIEDVGREKWVALGPDYHARLESNFITWIRNYVPAIATEGRLLASDAENLKKRPLFWTVGALNEGAERGEGVWQPDFELAGKAGIKVNATSLKCLHFPGVTVPEDLVAWIEECIAKAAA